MGPISQHNKTQQNTKLFCLRESKHHANDVLVPTTALSVSVIHNITIERFYCRFSCENLLEHLTETVHGANPTPHPKCEEFIFQFFQRQGGFVTWLLGNKTTEVASRPPWKIFHHSSGWVTTRMEREQEVAWGGNHQHSSFKTIEGGQDLSEAFSESIFSGGVVPSSSKHDGFHQCCWNTNPSGEAAQAVHQTTEMFPTTGKTPRTSRLNANWILALMLC